MSNGTIVQGFILEGFPTVQDLGKVLFLVHLLAYQAALVGNVVILSITCADSRLHTPMYFFLSIFFFLECSYMTAVIPKLLVIFLLGKGKISFVACFIQTFVFVFLGAVAFLLLAVMSLDRYVAICKPLRYPTIMNLRTCFLPGHFLLVSGLQSHHWSGGESLPVIILCPHVIPHFCGPLPLTHLSYSDTRSVEMLTFVFALFILLKFLIKTIAAYSNIVVMMVHLPPAKGPQKAFPTYLSHLTVFLLMYISCVFIYVKPKQKYRLDSNREAVLVNSVVTLLLNPVIVTLRNKQVHQALKKTMCRMKKYQDKTITWSWNGRLRKTTGLHSGQCNSSQSS